jgi:hypothetical protein
MAKRIPIFVGVASLEPTSITVELRSGSSLYEAMDAIDEEIGEGGNDGLYPSLYRFLLEGKEEQVTVVDLSNTTVEQCLNDDNADGYLRLEKTQSVWDERDTDALVKKAKGAKAKLEVKQTKKGKGSMIGDLPAMESFCSTSQKIFDEFGKLGSCFKSFNDQLLNCETFTATNQTLQTAGCVLSCAPMVGAAFAVLVPILKAINASGKVQAQIPKQLERLLNTLKSLIQMASSSEGKTTSLPRMMTLIPSSWFFSKSRSVNLKRYTANAEELGSESRGFGELVVTPKSLSTSRRKWTQRSSKPQR